MILNFQRKDIPMEVLLCSTFQMDGNQDKYWPFDLWGTNNLMSIVLCKRITGDYHQIQKNVQVL